MNERNFHKLDKVLSVIFIALTLVFIIAAFTNKEFFDWVFARHQNQLSWYIRPLFLIPFCFFAYKRSWSGIFGTVFLLITSMCWFSEPTAVKESVNEFLQMEKEYLTSDWGFIKIMLSMIVPISLTALASAFWKRSLWLGISVLSFIAVAKMLWSVAFGGESGKSVVLPAIVGLVICIGLIFIGFRKLEKKKKNVR